MKTFEEILNTITCNGMLELTNERARRAAMEYASQAIDQCAEQTNLIDDNGDISVNEQSILDVKKTEMKKLNWTTKKPKFDRECLVICASKIGKEWNYNIYQIQKAEYEDIWYWGWFDNGEEVGDITDMQADKYAVIELLK